MTEEQRVKDQVKLVEENPVNNPPTNKQPEWGEQISFVIVSVTPIVWLIVSYLATLNHVAGPDERILLASLTAVTALIAYWTKKKS